MRDKNHEGDHDPTACEAVRRTHRGRRRARSGKPKAPGSGYMLKEARGFYEAVNAIMR